MAWLCKGVIGDEMFNRKPEAFSDFPARWRTDGWVEDDYSIHLPEGTCKELTGIDFIEHETLIWISDEDQRVQTFIQKHKEDQGIQEQKRNNLPKNSRMSLEEMIRRQSSNR